MTDMNLRRWMAVMIVQGKDLDDAYEQTAIRLGGGNLDYALDPDPLDEEDARMPGEFGREVSAAPYVEEGEPPVGIPGTPGTLYVNAYAVTRHLGGTDGGTWFYHVADALGSIPVPATWRMTEMVGPELIPDGPIGWAVMHLQSTFAHMNVGDICEGGIRVDVEIEHHMAISYPGRAPDCGERAPTEEAAGPVL